jgi:hypothetical protein
MREKHCWLARNKRLKAQANRPFVGKYINFETILNQNLFYEKAPTFITPNKIYFMIYLLILVLYRRYYSKYKKGFFTYACGL